MRRAAIVIAAAVLAFGLACGVALAAGPPPGWAWLVGDINTGSFGELSGSPDLYGGAYYGGSVPAYFSGMKVLDTDVHDGYYEFEHSAASPNTVFLSETPNGRPTPLTIGKTDGQDVTPLVVSGQTGMTDDLQAWQIGGNSLSAIDSQGRLRINGIVLVPTLSNGKVELEAILPDGSTQMLVPVRHGS
jgi:hypothetical protein